MPSLEPCRRDRPCEIEVDGERYRIDGHGERRDVLHCPDGRPVGRLHGSPTLMWHLEAEAIDTDLLRSIAHAAIEEGVIGDLASD